MPKILIVSSVLINSGCGFSGDLAIRPGDFLSMSNLGLVLLCLSPSPTDADIFAELPGWEAGLELDNHGQLSLLSTG